MMSALTRIATPFRFSDPDLESKFASYYSERFVIQVRFALVLGILLILGDSAIDFAFDQKPAFRANMIRIFGIIPLLGVSFAVTFYAAFRKYLEAYCAAVSLLVAIAMFWAMRLLEVDGGMGLSSWVAPLNYTFAIIFVFLILGIRLVIALPVAVLITVAFVAIAETTLAHSAERTAQHIYHVVTVLLLGSFLGYWRENYLRRAFRADFELQAERRKSDAMLFDLIPPRIVEQLKERGPPIAESFAEATVVFADIVGFTRLATKVGPEHLLEILDRVFAGFDRASAAHGIEKVKTIGDSYMAIAFQTEDRENAAERVIRCGHDWLAVADEVSKEIGQSIALRIGAHTGPVIGGVIGSRRWSYDYWGDTVNVASRIEASCEPGRMFVSETTYWRARNGINFDSVGPIGLKGRGEVECYAVTGLHPQKERTGLNSLGNEKADRP